MKKCTKCKVFQPEMYFTKNSQAKDKLNLWCKDCTKRNSKNGYRQNRAERIKQVQAYSKTLKGRVMQSENVRRWLKKNPKKYLDHMLVKQAIKYGILKVEPCLVCGSEKVHAHHEDYDRPYNVKWLCPQHHKDAHNNLEDCGIIT